MKNIITYLFFLISVTGFSQTNYNAELTQIRKNRISLKANYCNDLDSVRSYLLETYNSTLFPYWQGTPWDYNGYTNTPRKSTIACGYFVSTTLQHLGFQWNRYKLAKMYSKDIVLSACDSVYEFKTKTDLHTYVRYRPDNMYILGLSGHVGLLLKYKGELWFIHSDYHNAIGPIKEKIEFSDALNESDVYWCGTFLSNKNVSNWLNGVKYGNEWK